MRAVAAGLTADYLDQQLVTDDGLRVLWGDWTGGENDYKETISVRSTLVSRAGAEALLAALQPAPELGRFSLPSAQEGERLGEGARQRRGGLTGEHVSAQLDKNDPWAEGLYYPGPVPSAATIARLGLSGSTDGRTWAVGTAGLLRSETWTRIQGYGRESETVPGSRLSGDQGFIKHLLDADREYRLLLSVEIRRRSPRYSSDQDEFEPYPWPYARYYLMEDDGVAHAL